MPFPMETFRLLLLLLYHDFYSRQYKHESVRHVCECALARALGSERQITIYLCTIVSSSKSYSAYSVCHFICTTTNGTNEKRVFFSLLAHIDISVYFNYVCRALCVCYCLRIAQRVTERVVESECEVKSLPSTIFKIFIVDLKQYTQYSVL